MPIDLSDIPTAVADYLDNHVTTEVSEVSSGGTIEDGEIGTFEVTVRNAGTPDGVRLVNVRYHLTVAPSTVANLVADSSALAPQRDTIDPNGRVLRNGELTAEMFIFPLAGTSSAELDIGESVTFTKEVKGIAAGAATIRCHIHAEIDEDSLFPKSENSPSGQREFEVT